MIEEDESMFSRPEICYLKSNEVAINNLLLCRKSWNIIERKGELVGK